MDEINTRYFLKPGSELEELRGPFIFGNYTVAMSGVSLIFLPKQTQYKEVELSEFHRKFLPKVLTQLNEYRSKSFDLPSVDIPEIEKCDRCEGTGLLTINECHECRGSGDVAWSSGYNNYGDVCKSCNGEGVISIIGKGAACNYCGGSKLAFNKIYPMFIQGFKVNAALIYPVIGIENLKVAFHKDNRHLFFYGSDCMGLIMGMAQ